MNILSNTTTTTENAATPANQYYKGFEAHTKVTTVITVDHAILDAKGRACGGFAKVVTTTWSTGSQTTVSIYATRNSAHYGASPGSVTKADHDTGIAHALAGLTRQGKSYTKKFAVVV